METKIDRKSWLQGATAQCEPPPKTLRRPVRLILLGAPGVGKGTQAEILSQRLGSCHISTGEVFRAAKALDKSELTESLIIALDHVKRGELVPDSIVLHVVEDRICCLHCDSGFLLDGFPRTLPQAEAFDEILEREEVQLDAVISYELDLDKIITRLAGRRTCPTCKAVFHAQNRPPKITGVCDHCGSALYQREDDRPESIRVRMEAYIRCTAPVADFYRRRNLLVPILAQGTPEEIFHRTMASIEERLK